MEPVRIGVMGCAEIAVRRVMPAIVASDEAELVAVASRDPWRAEEVVGRFGGRVVESYDQLLQCPDVEAVYVPLPAGLHATWVEAALLAGRHVLSEKPLTTDSGETERLLSLARSHALTLHENVMFVNHSQHAVVLQSIADGAIGELRSFCARFTIPRRADDDIRYRGDLGGGALLDVGVYTVRAAMLFLGDELTVAGAVLSYGGEVDIGGGALLCAPSGVSAHLTFGLDHAYRAEYQLHGSAGVLTVTRAFTPPPEYAPVIHLERPNGSQEILLPAEDQVRSTVGAFVSAVRGCGRAPQDPRCLQQAQLVDRIRQYAVAVT